MGFILDITRTCRRYIHTEEKLDETGAKWKISPRKGSVQFAQRTGVLASSPQNATRLLQLHQCTTNVVHTLMARIEKQHFKL
jgi:hypothetical protein